MVLGSDWGCFSERFDWCDDLTLVSPWIYYTFYVLLFGAGMSVMNIAVTTLYSEIIGPRRQGTHQGVFQMAGSIGRLVAPLLTSALYTKFGPRIPWIVVIVQISVMISLWMAFFKKMVPFHKKMQSTSEHNRLLMIREWLLGSNAMVASERINLAWGEETISKNTDDNETGEVTIPGKAEVAQTPWASIYIAGVCSFVQAAQFSILLSSMWPYLKKLNPLAEETQYGYIVALYSFGQCISAPSLGYWSNRIEQKVNTKDLVVAELQLISDNLSDAPLADPKLSKSICSTDALDFVELGNMSLLTAYSSMSSSKSDRSRAIACVIGGIATGSLIGPGTERVAITMHFRRYGLCYISISSDIFVHYNSNVGITD
ncbi:Major facilitator super domain-containing protein 8 [Parelaphostrongylus tenuis]|uniref:Major facilitator super domain-containing protein 8 n=1 Tax=Parelaphostrongylus tenuis TaxID=148309 RepID=A0AAD5WG53_PARTN|nr:Major facilitator super domain-containing protein 8 [Parelaphostrongylus tenuis]